MAGLARVTRRTRQTAGALGVNWGNPITRGLQSLFDLQAMADVAIGQSASANTAAATTTAGGVGRDYNGTANTQFAHNPRSAVTGAITIVAYVAFDSATNYSPIITKQNGPVSHNAYEFRLSYGATGRDLSMVRSNGSDYSIWQGASGDVVAADGKPQLVGVSVGALLNATGYFWANRAKVSGTLTGSGSSAAASDLGGAVWIGRRNDGATQFDGKIHYIAVFNRQLADAEWLSLYDNPWQLFAPIRKQSRAFTVGAAGGTTVDVPAGALTLTGYAPTVSFTAHQTIAVPAGALTLTGFAPTVSTSASQTIAVPAASLTLTGFAPTVSYTAHQTISVPAAALTLTAYAPTVQNGANYTVDVPAGALSLTGYAPTVSYTTNQSISVPVGALTLTGYAPTVTGGASSLWTQVSPSSGTWTPASLAPGTWTPQ